MVSTRYILWDTIDYFLNIYFLIKLLFLFSVVGKVETQYVNRNDSFESKNRQFTYLDILSITKNFDRILGKGGFGTVYYGYLDENYGYLGNTEVAVKMLSLSSAQGYKEFHAEVCNSRVIHANYYVEIPMSCCIFHIHVALNYRLNSS